MPRVCPLSLQLAAGLLASACLPVVLAAPVIVNGGFESGFTGWTRADQIGSEGTFTIQSGTTSPVNGEAVPAPPEGSRAAMTDAMGPGAHVLYQDFMASAGPATLSFQVFIGNRGDRFATPDTLDFSIADINQQARVDILKAGADPFSLASTDILLTLFTTPFGSDRVTGYNLISNDISALLAANGGQTLRLRFAETDNLDMFQMGVDDVRINGTTVVPEPTSFALAGLALAGLALSRRRA
jgi:hypothetical protein